ncbi:hypothetical protein [Streptomyces sp. NPDC001889]
MTNSPSHLPSPSPFATARAHRWPSPSAAAPPQYAAVHAEAVRARAALERGPLPPALKTFPLGACRLTSLALAAHLDRRGLGGWWLAGGVLHRREGDLTHAWLERDGLLLDITADQFTARGLPLRLGAVFLGTDRTWHDQFGRCGTSPAVPHEGDERARSVAVWLERALDTAPPRSRPAARRDRTP